MFRHENEHESERQLRKWGFELRGKPNAVYGVWDHYEDGRTIFLYENAANNGYWEVAGSACGRGTASLMNYLQGE